MHVIVKSVLVLSYFLNSNAEPKELDPMRNVQVRPPITGLATPAEYTPVSHPDSQHSKKYPYDLSSPHNSSKR